MNNELKQLNDDSIYKCVRSFSLWVVDDNGFVFGEHFFIPKGSEWHLPENTDYRLIGGKIRLESNEIGLIEVNEDILKEYFIAKKGMKTDEQ